MTEPTNETPVPRFSVWVVAITPVGTFCGYSLLEATKEEAEIRKGLLLSGRLTALVLENDGQTFGFPQEVLEKSVLSVTFKNAN